MRKLQSHERWQVLGVTGSGKSYFTQHRIVKTARRVVVWDIHAEYDLEQVDLAGLAERLDDDPIRVAVVPDFDDMDDLKAQFGVFVNLLRTLGTGLMIVVDEVGALCEAGASRPLNTLSILARHWGETGCPVVFVAQRAMQVPKTARAQASHVVAFRQTDPDDIAALSKCFGPKAEQIARLPRRKHLAWDESDAFKEKRT